MAIAHNNGHDFIYHLAKLLRFNLDQALYHFQLLLLYRLLLLFIIIILLLLHRPQAVGCPCRGLISFVHWSSDLNSVFGYLYQEAILLSGVESG